MEGQQRPPLQPNASYDSTSSSSVLTMSTLPTPDQAKSPFNTSPSGRVSFVFPQTNKSPSRAAPKATESAALVELPSADLIPSSISEPAPGRGSKVMLGPNRLKLVTDDALDSILRPSLDSDTPYMKGVKIAFKPGLKHRRELPRRPVANPRKKKHN
ncbi:hypothetical protein RHS01_05980 [Rhizoctonia solani]|uniref:Uncharacterized protein n=1 Tax=Rhizoctonia solani TaxID=456999 RepID=A0A8H7I9V8_9AGAM|nr:hypothetical protein RHS01_05980 [Rhizoctonia solani]